MIHVIIDIDELNILKAKGVGNILGKGRNAEILKTWFKGCFNLHSDIVLIIQDRQNRIPDFADDDKSQFIIPDFLIDRLAKELEEKMMKNKNLIRGGGRQSFAEKDNRYFAAGDSYIIFRDFAYARDSYLSSWDSSKNVIGSDCLIYQASIESQDDSAIIIDDGVYIDRGTQIIARHGSEIHLKKNVHLGSNDKIIGIEGSKIEIGTGSVIADNCEIVAKGEAAIIVGNEVSISHNNRLGACSRNIVVGDNSLFSYDIAIDENHSIYDREKEVFNSDNEDTIVGSHVWIGKGVFISSGAKIGSGSIVGALSFVNKVFPENSEIAGCPARIIKNDVKWRR